MKPYYKDEAITLYHGNCGEIMDGLPPVDLVVTDPPYGMEFRSNHRAIRHDAIVGDDFLPVHLIDQALALATRAAYFFCRWDNLQQMPPPKSVLVWVKNNWSMGDLKHEHGRQWEACCFYAKERHEFIKRIPDVLFADRTGNNLHPTQKPESLMMQLIEANVGEVILDPFAGSGTTLRAAKDAGRKAIGIEIDERHCETIARRMAQEVFNFS